MERKDIQEKDTWDLSLIYQDNQDFYTDLQKAKDLLNVLLQQKDDFLNNKETFLSFHENYIQMGRYVQKLHCFAHLHCDVEPNNQDYQTMYAAILTFYDQITSSLDFYTVQMIEHSDIVKDYLKDESLAD